MSNTEKNHLHGKYQPTGYYFGGIGTNKTAFSEIGVVAPKGNNAGNAWTISS